MNDKKADYTPTVLLDRELAIDVVEKHFAKHLNVLRQIVDEGTGLLEKIRESERAFDFVDRVTISHLFVHWLKMADGAHLLLREAATYAVQPILRSIVETSIYLVWILQDDTERRSRYYVRNHPPNRSKQPPEAPNRLSTRFGSRRSPVRVRPSRVLKFSAVTVYFAAQ